MSTTESSRAHAAADPRTGSILATVEIGVPPERVFRALTSEEIIKWWVRAGVFDTREWSGDVRVGGKWRSAGIARGAPYVLEGEYLEVDPPRKLVHTWHMSGMPGVPTVVTYLLEPVGTGTRITLRHEGFAVPAASAGACAGWETSFVRLAELLAA